MKNKLFIVAGILLIVGLLSFPSRLRLAAAHGQLTSNSPFDVDLPLVLNPGAAPSETPTPTLTDTSTLTQTPTPTLTDTPTFTRTPTPTLTDTPTLTQTPTATLSSFTFVSMGDSHYETSPDNTTGNNTTAANQIAALNPDFIIHNGDYTDDGIYANDSNGQWTGMTAILSNAGLFNKTFIVRGNHDDHITGSSATWESLFVGKLGVSRSLTHGFSNYVAIDASSTYLTYSFDYGNSRFIAVDVPGNAELMQTAEYTFVDQRLTDAENIGLTHAFIYFHGPDYCIGTDQCACTTRTDVSCTPSDWITLVNKHPIISATFHGHQHALAHIHMDNTRISTLTHPYEEFITSSTGIPWDFTIYPDRVDDNYTSFVDPSFALIRVEGTCFTVSFYHTTSTAPVWTKTFNKGSGSCSAILSAANKMPNSAPAPTFTATSMP